MNAPGLRAEHFAPVLADAVNRVHVQVAVKAGERISEDVFGEPYTAVATKLVHVLVAHEDSGDRLPMRSVQPELKHRHLSDVSWIARMAYRQLHG